MTIYAYSNNGLSFRAVDSTYEAQPGEFLFNNMPTLEELSSVFPDYAIEVNKKLFISQAQFALDKSDSVVMSYYENSIPVPASWISYRSELRNIIKTGIGPLPTPPIT